MTTRTNNFLHWVLLLTATVLSVLLETSCVEAGIIKGFNKDVPSVEEILPTFERATRQLLTEDDTDGFPTGPRHGVRDASPKIEPTEVSFMIVSERDNFDK